MCEVAHRSVFRQLGGCSASGHAADKCIGGATVRALPACRPLPRKTRRRYGASSPACRRKRSMASTNTKEPIASSPRRLLRNPAALSIGPVTPGHPRLEHIVELVVALAGAVGHPGAEHYRAPFARPFQGSRVAASSPAISSRGGSLRAAAPRAPVWRSPRGERRRARRRGAACACWPTPWRAGSPGIHPRRRGSGWPGR